MKKGPRSIYVIKTKKQIIYFQKTKTKMSFAKLRAAIEAQQSPARRGAGGGGGGGGGDHSRNKKSVIEVSLFYFVLLIYIYIL